jgi:hypothetical protein
LKTNPLKSLLFLLLALGSSSLAWGYTYIFNTATGLPLRWPPGTIVMKIYADNVTQLSDHTTRATAIQAALQNWNPVLGDEQFTSTINPAGAPADNDQVNQVSFASTAYGTAFDASTLAVTTGWSIGNQRTEADTIFNTNGTYTWDSYRDSLLNHPHNTIDIQRVATHEFGHNLGLDHPDQATPPQGQASIMHSTISNITVPTSDDIAGVQNLYGPSPLNSIPANDNFANAINITLSNNAATMNGFNVNATKESGEPNHAGNVGGRSIWWKWTAPSTGSVSLDTAGSYSDTTLGVYTGSSVSNLTTIASNDDVQDGVIQHSAVTFNATGGTLYYFAVDGFNGSDGNGADSAAITLNLAFTPGTNVAPTFTTQPASQTVTVGAGVTFTAAASGSPAPTFQWQKNTVNIGGATGSSYSIASTVAGDAGTYTVVASNSAGTATSNGAVLTVNPPPSAPSFTTQPVSQTVTVGSPVTFTSAATGFPAPTYQWKKGGTNISGATGSSYSIASASLTDAGSYTVVATNSVLTATSNAATLSVRAIAADFNGDGKSDLLWQNTTTGERSLWLMNGTSFQSSAGLGTISNDWSIAATGDFNGDGKPDILWQNSTTGERLIWLMNGTAFGSSVSLGTVPLAWSIAGAGDFNGDGKTDILWQNRLTGERLIWLMNGTAFGSSVSLGVIPPEWSIAGTGDFNGDGKIDLLWTNTRTGELSVWLMNGTAFSSAVSLGIVPLRYQVAGTGDYNGDGQPDILWTDAATGDRSVWLMNGTAYGSSVSLTTLPLEWVLDRPFLRHVAADFNADANSDLVWQNTSTGERLIWLMDGSAYLGNASIGTVSTSWSIAALGDFNGDGKTDLLWQNTSTGERAVWLMNGTTYLSGISLGVVPTQWSIAGAADFNGDGNTDILWQNTSTGERIIWFMNGSTFVSGGSLGVVSTDWSIAGAADFNGDGKPDIVWQNTVTGERVLWLMNGTSFVSSISLGVISTDWSIVGTGDFNADGGSDIVWQNTATGERMIWFMNGTSYGDFVSLGVVPTAWSIRD